MHPKVSVLLPTYNYAHYLPESIASVLAQTFADFELIIVDDCSFDHTEEVVQQFLQDSRVRFIKNPHNLGLVHNFNKCLTYARGTFIKYVLADDLLHPQLLEMMVPVLEQYPQVSLVTSWSETFGAKIKKRVAPLSGLQSGKRVILECLKTGKGNWIGEPSVVMFRRSDIMDLGGFNPQYTCLVDLDMWLRLLTKGDCFIIPETLAYFRIHDQQASSKKNLHNWFDEYFFYKMVKEKDRYQVRLDASEIDAIVRDRAVICAKGMYLVLPAIYQKKHRPVFRKAFRIASQEKVMGVALYQLLQKRLRMLKAIK